MSPKDFIPMIIGLIGALLGGAVSWGIYKQKMTQLEKELAQIAGRVAALETFRVDLSGQLGRIEANLLVIMKHLNI